MKNKKILITSIIIGILVLSIGLSYAVMNFNILGRNNSQLVLGNIWMHYNENNQLIIDGNNEVTVKDITLYTINPIMTSQEVEENELFKCVNLFNGGGIIEVLDEGSTTSFCQGNGTIQGGITFQQFWDNSYQQDNFMEQMGNELVDNNIMVLENDTYIVNPIMSTQELNELSRCIAFYSDAPFDEGSDAESFCRGTGTINGGMTFQNMIDEESLNESFLEYGGQLLIDNGIIVENKISYTSFKINPIMKEEETGTGVLGKCEEMFSSVSFDEGSTPTTLCQGTGTVNGVTLQETIDLVYQDEEFMESVGYQMLKEKIILPVLDLKYFEFTIDGKNTYTKKDIWYEIVLMHGDNHETRSERIKDEFLTFTLTAVIDGEEVQLFNNRSYNDLKSQRIWVDTIPANTINDIEKTYRLYIGFIHNIRVGEVGPNSNAVVDYSFDTWNNQVYGSIKVKVVGDFIEKDIEYKISERCFETQDIDDGNVVIVGYDKNCTKDLIIPNIINNKNVKEIAPYAFAGLEISSLTFEENSNLASIYNYSFINNYITSVSIPDSVTFLSCLAFDSNVNIEKRADLSCSLIETDPSCFNTVMTSYGYKHNSNITAEEVAVCVTFLTGGFGEEEVGNTIAEGESYDAFCRGTGTIWGDTLQTILDGGWFSEEELTYLEENNIIIKNQEITIIGYDTNCGTDVVIPSEFNGLPVTVIGNGCKFLPMTNKEFNNIKGNNLIYKDSKFKIEPMEVGYCGAFENRGLTSVVIPNTVRLIEDDSFKNNQLTNITIPNSVTNIGNSAFESNYLKKVIFENNSKLREIYSDAFTTNKLTNVNIPDSVTYLSCDAFDSNVTINKRCDSPV